jgi:hypothetical protein
MADYGNLSFGYNGLRTEQFPDPFFDIASAFMPETIQRGLRWSEFLVNTNGIYCQALDRVASYFVTELNISNAPGKKQVGLEEKRKWEDFFYDSLHIKAILRRIALDFLTYGNSFTSLLIPFRRSLCCPKCNKFEAPLRHIYNERIYQFVFQDYNFVATCPLCKYRGVFERIDRRTTDADELLIKRYSPHEIEILYDYHSTKRGYIWRIPELYRQCVRAGTLWHLENAPWEVLQAVKRSEVIFFEDDYIYHLLEEPAAGIDMGGWGLSRVLANFRQGYLYQVLWRYNEAICLDHVVPFRVLTPMPRPSGGGPGSEMSDPIFTNLRGFNARVERMLRQHRRDPAGWHVLPFPLQYQAIGGDASQFAPQDLLQLATDLLLTSIGIPVELFKGSLSVQAAGPALRLFEANWSHLVTGLNSLLQHTADVTARLLGWEPIKIALQRVTIADDIQKQMAILQLSAQRMASQTSAMRTLGLDFAEENRRMLEEQRFVAESQQAMQEDMQASQQMGDMGSGATPAVPGQPAAGPPSQGAQPGQPPQPFQAGPAGQVAAQQVNQPDIPVSPMQLLNQAQTLASQLQYLNETNRRSELNALQNSDPALHELVLQALRKQREGTDGMTKAAGVIQSPVRPFRRLQLG